MVERQQHICGRIRPRRNITGISAILLPFTDDDRIDWDAFAAHVARTADVGIMPAVNMDTGYVHLLDDTTRGVVLERTRDTLGGRPFVAGAFVGDQPGSPWDPDSYRHAIDDIEQHGGIPVIFQSYGLTGRDGAGVIDAYEQIARHTHQFIAFELGQMFAPFGRIYDIDTFTHLLDIRECIGAKHSSLDRQLEWERLRVRDMRRPEFKVFTGNDLAIDMVMYGSDYLLGLSTFAPDVFARRDACWETGDPAFHEINDVLQYLGCFAFRAPVPAYKHSAAQFLKLRDWIGSDRTHPASPRRQDSDIAVLRDIATRMEAL
jgi:dihydrodipicolinate synthase/N-acetylneuraminate lyase